MPTPAAAETHDLRNAETPVLVLDQQRMDANIRRMREQLARLGVAFRPHVKTSKSIDVVRRTIGAATGPITVSSLKEAEYFAGYGFTDILYAVGLPVGTLLRILPNHACATSAQHDRYHVVDGHGLQVKGVWPRLQGW